MKIRLLDTELGLWRYLALWTGVVLLFTAPAFFPQDLLTPALHDISRINPLTYVVNGIRALLEGDRTLGSPWAGLGAACGLAVSMTALATFALKERLRTL